MDSLLPNFLTQGKKKRLIFELLRVLIARKKHCFCFPSFVGLYEMLEASKIHCSDHTTIYVSQTSLLYALNLYSDVYQSYVNKTGKRKVL